MPGHQLSSPARKYPSCFLRPKVDNHSGLSGPNIMPQVETVAAPLGFLRRKQSYLTAHAETIVFDYKLCLDELGPYAMSQ